MPQSIFFLLTYQNNFVEFANENGGIRALDYGGAVGQYMPLLRYVLNFYKCKERIYYDVIDNEVMCNKGRELFSENKKADPASSVIPRTPLDEVTFYSNPDLYKENFDVFICVATLMYIEDLTDMVRLISEAKPKYVFLAFFLANHGPDSPKMAALYEGGEYYEVTAHSIDKLKTFFTGLNYTEIPGAEYDLSEISESIRELYPDVRSSDLFFTLETP